MATEAEMDDAIQQTEERIARVGDDTVKFSQADSVEFYQAIASFASERANMIQTEMEDG